MSIIIITFRLGQIGQSIQCFPYHHEDLISVFSVHINICLGKYTPLIPTILVQAHEAGDIAGHLLAELLKVIYTSAQMDLRDIQRMFQDQQ